MRICISGSQCSGKSTLMNALRNLNVFKEYQFIDEPVRRLVKEKGIQINKDSGYFSQLIILEEHHRNAIRYPNMVTDRGALDAFTYATYDYIKGKYTFGEWRKFKQIYDETITMYQSIFVLPPLEMKDDGFRSLDVEWQKEIYDLMFNISNSYGNYVFDIPHGNVNDYVKFILQNV